MALITELEAQRGNADVRDLEILGSRIGRHPPRMQGRTDVMLRC